RDRRVPPRSGRRPATPRRSAATPRRVARRGAAPRARSAAGRGVGAARLLTSRALASSGARGKRRGPATQSRPQATGRLAGRQLMNTPTERAGIAEPVDGSWGALAADWRAQPTAAIDVDALRRDVTWHRRRIRAWLVLEILLTMVA